LGDIDRIILHNHTNKNRNQFKIKNVELVDDQQQQSSEKKDEATIINRPNRHETVVDKNAKKATAYRPKVIRNTDYFNKKVIDEINKRNTYGRMQY